MRSRQIAAVATVALALAACSASESLEQTAWEMEFDPPTQSPASIVFSADEVAGSTGCNSVGGRYEVDGDSISIGPLRMTLAACASEDLAAQEAALLAALDGAASYSVSGDTLELIDSDGEVLATFDRVEVELAGTDWSVISHNTGTEAVTSLIIGTEITLSFGDDGSVSGSSGCNTYMGEYEVAGDYDVLEGQDIEISRLANTEMACLDPEGVMDQELQYLAALGNSDRWLVRGGILELRSDDGALQVQAQPAG